MAGTLPWLNGPGLRWLAPMVAAHFARKADLRLTFTLEGSLTAGISIKDLRLQSAKTLADLTVNRATPDYLLTELARGRIQGIRIDGLHADLHLGADTEKPAAQAKKPFDLQQLARTIRSVRGRVIPLAIDLTDVRLCATRDGKPVFTLAASHLHHATADPSITLLLGAITDATGREWPARESRIAWNPTDILIERIDPLPGASIRGLALHLPENEGPSAETEIRIDDAVFAVTATPGFASISADLREGRLHSGQVADHFALKLPATADLTSFSAHVEDLLPEPAAATGAASFLLENVTAGDWTIPELGLGAEMETDRCSLTANARVFDTAISLTAEAPVSHTGGLQAGDVRGHLNVPDVPNLIAGLAEHFKAIDPDAPVPPAMLDGDFTVALNHSKPSAATASLILKPADPKIATRIDLSGTWRPDQPLTLALEIDGLKANADYHITSAVYQGNMEIDHFDSTRIERWLAIVRAKMQGAAVLTGLWSGGGETKTGKHHGKLTLARAEWSRESVPPVAAKGGISYDWPAVFVTKDLQVQAKDQTISADAKLTAGLLELKNLRWRDHANEIAGGSASLPAPENFANWRETLAHDLRPVAVSLESKVLSLALLKDWLPAAAKLDARSTGRVQLKVSGTYAAPTVDIRLEAKDLRSPEQPKLPPADLVITVAGHDGRLKLEGTATAPDYPAAVMTASMPFRPAEWADPSCACAACKSCWAFTMPGLFRSAKFTDSSTVSGIVGALGVTSETDAAWAHARANQSTTMGNMGRRNGL